MENRAKRLAQNSYLTPKTKVSECLHGRGLFAIQKILKDELIIDWQDGPGVIYSTAEAQQCELSGNPYTLQVDVSSHLVSVHLVEDCDYINHSCEPNCGMQGRFALVAMRDIFVGEELTYDYAMTEAADYFRLDCLCGHPSCRGLIKGSDWQQKELRKKYGNYFSQYILKMLEKMEAENGQE